MAEPFLARGAVRDGAWPHHIVDPLRQSDLPNRFDFIAHDLLVQTDQGDELRLPLRPQSVATFHAAIRDALASLSLSTTFDGQPNEVADPIPFGDDETHASYDPEAAQRFWRVLLQVDRVFRRFRTGFLGKSSPVHLFWGSFDLAVTRFSGRPAPRHPGGIPHLPDAVTREAYSHEVSSAGFWPGGGAVEYPAFYSYAYPSPEGFSAATVRPDAAFFHRGLGEFVLPYESVRNADDPDVMLLSFLQSTYEAAADLGRWDRPALECGLGQPGRPRLV